MELKLKPEVKTAWLQALRSGEYQQGHEQLRQGNTFCCLGVLCDLAAKSGVGHWEEYEGELKYFKTDSDRVMAIPPSDVLRWATTNYDHTSYDFTVVVNDFEFTIWNFNDGSRNPELRRHSFEEIADIIEKNF